MPTCTTRQPLEIFGQAITELHQDSNKTNCCCLACDNSGFRCLMQSFRAALMHTTVTEFARHRQVKAGQDRPNHGTTGQARAGQSYQNLSSTFEMLRTRMHLATLHLLIASQETGTSWTDMPTADKAPHFCQASSSVTS